MVKRMKSFNQAVLIGCDAKQEWMLEWWFKNYKQHNNLPVVFADFGCTPQGLKLAQSKTKCVIDMTTIKEKGWFKKPKSMLACPADKTLWIDLDAEIKGSLKEAFSLFEPNKLAMVEDHPWKKRRGELWHNSGVVGFIGKPQILKDWAARVEANPQIGDQEVLHNMLSPILKITYIKDLPHKYNVLRIDIDENNVPKDPVIVHWTGSKGKDEIRRQLNA
jgi:hypothetical protein